MHKYDVQLIEKGIYYLKGEFFPIQFIVTKDLTNDIHDTDVVSTLISEYDKHQNDNRYKSIMDILAEKDAYIKQLEAQLGIATA